MALEKAGINLTIQGEAQYIAGLRNINREMDLMATNTKLAVAQLGQGASPTQKFNTQMRSLGAEIQKASTQTMVLRNRNKELPNEIFKTGKSLDGLKDEYEKQVKVLESYRQKRDEVYKDNTFYSEDATKAREAFNEQQVAVKELEGEINKLEGAYNGMLDEYERMPNAMAEAQLATQQLLNEQAKLRQEYLDSGGVLAGFADKLESGSKKLQEYGRTVSDIGDSLMWVTGAIVAGGGGALKAFMDWETGLRSVKKTNDEIFDSNGNLVYSYEDLESGLRELARTIPVTHTELAELAEIAGRLQVPTDEVVMFTEVVAKLGETTNLTSEDAAEQLGKFINITGAGTETTLNIANALVELGNSTASSERETLRMSTRWASTGDIIGMTDDQILALSASVISLGIRTEAGPYLNNTAGATMKMVA